MLSGIDKHNEIGEMNMYGDRNGGYGSYDNQRSFAPVQEGEEIDVRIEAVGEKGDGIAKKKGFVLFIPNTKEGQEVRVRITKVLRKVGFAEVIGDASGPIEEDVKPAREQAPVVQPRPEQPSVEDSEDFGEEPAEEEQDSDEAPESPEEEREYAD